MTEAVDALERARGRAMGARLVREARALGVDPDALSRILIAHDLAMAVRDRAVPDDHDPDYLHPGRSALVAMTDGLLASFRLKVSRRSMNNTTQLEANIGNSRVIALPVLRWC